MRILLLHNVDAGVGFSVDALIDELERYGHELVDVVDKQEDSARLREPSAQLVVVAGGDGTVATASVALAGHRTPLAILPLGTANNIATSLGVRGSVRQLIEHWPDAGLIALDLGVASGDWGETWFVEGVGGGLISAGIAALSNAIDEPPNDPPTQLSRALRGFRQILSHTVPSRWTYTLDGARFQENLILLEVLNIGSVGPNLELASDADPCDGYFSIVSAGEDLRPDLEHYLECRIAGKPGRLSLPTERARRVDIEAPEELHLDDRVRTSPSLGNVSIRVEAAALQVLV